MAITMAAKALLLLGFSLLLSSSNMHVGAHVGALPPATAPAYPPTYYHHAPTPVPPPPPSNYHRVTKLLAVEGVVLCKNCKFLWQDNLSWNTPLLGAVVRVECNTKYGNVNVTGTTDKYGYFFITTYNILWDAHEKCKVFLVSSSSATCEVPNNIFGGITGATLKRVKTLKPPPGSSIYTPTYELFKVGPLAYQPKYPC